jgi:hypothetical protein
MDEDGEFAPADKTGPGEEVDEDGEITNLVMRI